MNELQIFEAAQAIVDAEARQVFLERECAGNPRVLARIRAMLGTPMSESFLARPFIHSPAGHDSPDPSRSTTPRDPLVGKSVGGVTLVRIIDEGGMGRVYEGRQETPRRTVAVKVVREELATPKVVDRFMYEAQILARLRHPGIGEVYFAGTFGEGPSLRPYFVMAYIANAKPLTHFADDLMLSTRGRLALFQKVCDAVAHGHMNGVTHRDLKPSNILVDDSGQPKVIDFGIAKTTDSDVAATVQGSDIGKLIGTYQYMSPEQFDADPHAIDVRCDVYALGVVLYELLTGAPPYALTRKALDEIARIVKHEEPTAITRVNKTLGRDIGIIAGKCLEKDKTRRYSSASELAADIGRYLSGDPIAAVAPSLWDSVVRTSRKHKAAAASAAGIAMSLMMAMLGISVFAIRATEERDAANHARAAEKRQSEKAEAESMATKRQLYIASMYKLGTTLTRPNRRFSRDILDSATKLFQAVSAEPGATPIELKLVGANLDEALITVKHHDRAVRHAAFSPDGRLVATASDDNSICLSDPVSGRLIARLGGHSGPVTNLAFSPDGAHLATASEDSMVRLWNTQTGECLSVFETLRGPLTSLAYSPDGHRVAAGSRDGSVRIWRLSDGESHLLGRLGSWLHAVAFSPDGNLLATASGNTPMVWDVSTGRRIAVLEGHEFQSTCLAFTPAGRRLATGSADKTAMLWDAMTGERLAVFRGGEGWITSLGFSPDGEMLATGSTDGTIRTWDVRTARALGSLEGHLQDISCLTFIADGTRLASGSNDGSVRLWQVPGGEPIAVLHGHEAPITSIDVGADGRRLVTGSLDASARVWDSSGHECVADLLPRSDGVRCLAFSPDGRRLTTAGYADAVGNGSTGYGNPEIRIWDVHTCQLLFSTLLGKGGSFETLTYTPDGSRIAAADQDGSAVIIDAFTGEATTRLPGNRTTCGGIGRLLSFSADGGHLATAPSERTVRVWDTSTGEAVASLEGDAFVTDFVFSPDGRHLAITRETGSVQLWSADTFDHVGTFAAGDRSGPPRGLAFSPDGSSLVVRGSEGATVWNTAAAKALAVFDKAHDLPTFSPAGRRFAAASNDNCIRVWDLDTHELLADLDGHERDVTAVAFSPDGARIATGSRDATVRLWAASTGDTMAVLNGHGEGISCLAFSPDGDLLATAADDGTCRIWGLSNATIHRNRVASTERRERLRPLVDGWFSAGLADAKRILASSKDSLPPEDWHEAAGMVLRRATEPLK